MKAREKNKKIWLITAGLFLSGCPTLLPYAGATHQNIIGYSSLCTFTPMSTCILWGLAGIVFLRPQINKRRKGRNPFKSAFYYFFGTMMGVAILYTGYLMVVGILSWEADDFPEISLTGISDGQYIGQSKNSGKKVIVKVTIRKEKIHDIEVLSSGYASKIGLTAFEFLPDRIIKAQKLNVDSVTGATHSSIQIKSAVSGALQRKTEKNR